MAGIGVGLGARLSREGVAWPAPRQMFVLRIGAGLVIRIGAGQLLRIG